jgi:hypothetical protein
MAERSMRVLWGVFLASALVACGSSGSSRESFDPTGQGGDPTADGTTADGPGAPTTGDAPAPQPDKIGCAGSQYAEPLPTSASLTDVPFSSGNAQQYMLTALDRRYPWGKSVLSGGLSSPLAQQQGSCFDRFLHDKSSADSVLNQAETVVHECGHFYDLGQASGSKSAYVIAKGVTLSCDAGDTTKRGGKTFARSLLRGDAYYAKRPACGGQPKMGCDSYADTYLDGSDTNSTFESGDQGFNSLLEEANQYVNSLATSLAFQETFAGGKSSQRDGILTFLWYIERFVAMAHAQYPQAYATLSQDACWRQAILSVWDRGWFYLDATTGIDELGLDDTAIEPLTKDTKLVAEIDALRTLECQ